MPIQSLCPNTFLKTAISFYVIQFCDEDDRVIALPWGHQFSGEIIY